MAGAVSIERITAGVYTDDGDTLVGALSNLDGQAFRDEVTQRGNANFRIPLDDAADLAADSIVKFTWRGEIRFGCLINSESCEYAVDGRRWLSFQNQPGLLALYDQAVIAPEYGLDRRSGDTRRFGFMSKMGAWFVSADWDVPDAVAFSAETGPRENYPPELKASNPSWIAASPGPDTSVGRNTKNWFRYEFTTSDDLNARAVFTFDNYGTVYLDGEEIIPVDTSTPWGWRSAQAKDVFIPAGDHVFAVLVENAPPEAGHTYNPVALIGTMFTLDANGNPDGELFKTNGDSGDNWLVTSVKPGWHKGYLIKTIIEEAQARGIPGPNALGITFTDTHDSDGDAWDTVVDEYSFDIENTTVADVIISLCESGINGHVNAASMEFDLFNRMGANLYSSVEYKLGADGGSLMSYQLDTVNARATSVTAHIEDGTWEQVDDTAGITAVGRREVGYSLGTAPTAASAHQFALDQLAQTAAPQIQITAKTATLAGPQFYDDHDLGDSVKLPGPRMVGHLRGRGLAVTVGQEGDRVTVQPEFMKSAS